MPDFYDRVWFRYVTCFVETFKIQDIKPINIQVTGPERLIQVWPKFVSVPYPNKKAKDHKKVPPPWTVVTRISFPFVGQAYRKFPKYSETQKICCYHFKIWTMWLCHRIMSPNDADRMANSADQTAPLGAVWSGSALFAQLYLSENLGSLR